MTRTHTAAGEKIPTTLEEAARRVLEILRDAKDGHDVLESEDIGQFGSRLHHGLGRWIRNNWGLWSRDTELFTDISGQFYLVHADDMSGLIMDAAWMLHTTEAIDKKALKQTAARYLEHWRKILLED